MLSAGEILPWKVRPYVRQFVEILSVQSQRRIDMSYQCCTHACVTPHCLCKFDGRFNSVTFGPLVFSYSQSKSSQVKVKNRLTHLPPLLEISAALSCN